MPDALYIHIPFCIRKCNYCDFLSFSSTEDMRRQYVDYLIKEIHLYPKYTYNTVYFGGGTPSLLKYEDIKRILDEIDIATDAEITIEVNPKTVDYNFLKNIREIGINRLSIGIQTFNNDMLKILGRLHDSKEAIETYQNARKAGFTNISLDLMFSLPNQTLEEVKHDLTQLFLLKPEHFSIYSLIWEEGTPFFKQLEQGILKMTDNDLEADMYEKIILEAKLNGYEHYEISNFSLPTFEAKHNSKYWENKEYVGIGLGASGYINNLRYKNQMQFSKYYDNISNGILPILEKELLTKNDIEEYKYMLGLRLLKKGIQPQNEYLDKCIKLEKDGFLKKQGNAFILSKKGIMFANDVLTEFL